MKRISLIRALLKSAGCAVCLVFAGCGKGNVYAPPPPPAVTVMPAVQRDTVVYTRFPGQIRAVEEVEITARVKGYLRSVDFEDDQVVTNRQQLFVIEPDQYAAARDSGLARLEKAQAVLRLTETSYKRMAQAYETRSVSEIDLLNAEAEMSAAAADVMVAEADLKAAELDLSYTTVKAPMDGRVSRHLVSVGNLVGAEGSPSLLTTLVPLDPMHVYFNVEERFVLIFQKMSSNGREGSREEVMSKVEIELADGSRYPVKGSIDYVGNELDPSTGTLEIRAVFANPGHTLISGQFGRVMIPRTYKAAVLVPNLTVQRDIVGDYVLTVGERDEVIRKPVKPGPLVGEDRVILEGINPGDRIIIKGLQRSRPGIKVDAQTDVTGEADGEVMPEALSGKS